MFKLSLSSVVGGDTDHGNKSSQTVILEPVEGRIVKQFAQAQREAVTNIHRSSLSALRQARDDSLGAQDNSLWV